jgi:broad specificity phosphatase PhoE
MIDKNSDINLWVIRHGYRIDFSDPHWTESAVNPYNPPLSPVGVEQAEETADRLKDERVDYIIASPFLRTVQTANIIAEKIGKKVILEAGLSEWLTLKDFDYNPELDDPYILTRDYPNIDPESGHLVHTTYPEDSDALNKRIDKTISKIITKYGNYILIISHGSPIRSIFKSLVHYDGEEFPSMCSVSRFHYQGGNWELEINDDSEHLTHPDTTRRVYYRDRWADLAKSKES